MPWPANMPWHTPAVVVVLLLAPGSRGSRRSLELMCTEGRDGGAGSPGCLAIAILRKLTRAGFHKQDCIPGQLGQCGIQLWLLLRGWALGWCPLVPGVNTLSLTPQRPAEGLGIMQACSQMPSPPSVAVEKGVTGRKHTGLLGRSLPAKAQPHSLCPKMNPAIGGA